MPSKPFTYDDVWRISNSKRCRALHMIEELVPPEWCKEDEAFTEALLAAADRPGAPRRWRKFLRRQINHDTKLARDTDDLSLWRANVGIAATVHSAAACCGVSYKQIRTLALLAYQNITPT